MPAKFEIMFVVFGFMAAGVLTGWLLRRHRAGWTGKVTMALIWLLLLILGVEVGSDRRIVESLPTLGVEAAVIAVVSLLGSCLLAWLLWTVMRCKENAGYGGNSQTKSVQWTGVRRKGNAGKKEGRG